MSKLIMLRTNERGTAVIETAIALPVLVLFLWGIFQVGIAGQAIAGMQHGLGEGARLATLCLTPSSTGVCTIPADANIKQRISDKVFGTGVGTFVVADPVTGAGYKDLSVTFSMPLDFLFFQGPTINLTRTKRVYIANLS
jgi:Flp pilus assembly protein TadG